MVITMKNKPTRILHVLGSVNLGGAESRIMDLYRNLDREKIQFDFMVHSREKGFFEQEIISLGGKIYSVPRFRFFNILSYRSAWKHFFTEHSEFRAIHGHMTSTASVYLPIAKRAGIPVTIAHARSAGTDPGLKGLVTRFLRRNLAKKAGCCLACSQEAGISVFGRQAVQEGLVRILPNAIETDKYAWNPEIRERLREELGLEEAFVVGHVGRFHYAKNHEFLIRIFSEIKKKIPKAILLLLGEGSLMGQTKALVRELQIDGSVIFAGNQSPVSDYYQAMDYLVFPSRFEGMPGTVVEAQASGLRCLVSDGVTSEVKATELVTFFSLGKSAAEWAAYVEAHVGYTRGSRIGELIEKGFDVGDQIRLLEKIYGL